MTQQDLITEYDECQKRFDISTRQAEKVVQTVFQAASLLKDWQSAQVSNLKNWQRGGWPVEIALGRKSAINAATWPTAEQIANVLLDWHDAKRALVVSFRKLPESIRSRMTSPED